MLQIPYPFFQVQDEESLVSYLTQSTPKIPSNKVDSDNLACLTPKKFSNQQEAKNDNITSRDTKIGHCQKFITILELTKELGRRGKVSQEIQN